MLSMLFFGLLFFVTGAAGLSLSRSSGGPQWTGRPVLSQVGIGLGMLALGVYLARRLDDPRLRRTADRPPVKHVGSGRSAGAAKRKSGELQS